MSFVDPYLNSMKYTSSRFTLSSNIYEHEIHSRFENGDLIYGFNYQINNYIENTPYFESVDVHKQAVTMNQFKLNWTEYGKYNQIKTASTRITTSFINSILKNINYKDILSSEDLGFKNNKLGLIEKYESKKSKAGLKWATESGNRIDFILDDIDMNSVIRKHDIFDENGEVKLSTTNSELRWLYRNRNDGNVQKSVQFWKNGHHANAPWADNPEAWSQYKPRTEVGAIQQGEYRRTPGFARRRQSYRDAALNELSYIE